MNLALMMLLALLWSVVLLPSALRSRRKSLHHSMGGFARAMQILAGSEPPRRDTRVVFVPADPRRIVAPPRGAELARERRRRTLVMLLSAVGTNTLLALAMQGVFTVLAVASVVALVAFVAALRQLAQQERRARTLVRLDDRRQLEQRELDEDRWAVGV